MTLAAILAFLTSIGAPVAAVLSPFGAAAAAGGGLLSMAGGLLGSGKWKWIAAGIGLLAVVIAAVALTVHYEHLQLDREALDRLRGEHVALQGKVDRLAFDLGCAVRPNENERDLFVCVPALRAEAATAALKIAEANARVVAEAEARRQREVAALKAESDAIRTKLARFQNGAEAPVLRKLMDQLHAREALRAKRKGGT